MTHDLYSLQGRTDWGVFHSPAEMAQNPEPNGPQCWIFLNAKTKSQEEPENKKKGLKACRPHLEDFILFTLFVNDAFK